MQGSHFVDVRCAPYWQRGHGHRPPATGHRPPATGHRPPTSLGTRTYAHLSEIEHEAFHARIWGGLHYRQAMTDAYAMGHRTAVSVMAALG